MTSVELGYSCTRTSERRPYKGIPCLDKEHRLELTFPKEHIQQEACVRTKDPVDEIPMDEGYGLVVL